MAAAPAQVEHLRQLTGRLRTLGEDVEELAFWEDFFPLLSEEERERVLATFTREAAELERIRNTPS